MRPSDKFWRIFGILRKGVGNLRKIANLRRHLYVLMHAFIMGRIDYCNSLLYGLPATHINKLQRVQNAAARLICLIPRFSHVTPVLYSLHWLPVQFRIDFKILIITFKAIHGHAPEYICNLIHIKTPSTYGLRSNSELLLAPPSTKTMKTLGDRAFTAAAPSLWNKLPSEIRDARRCEFHVFVAKTISILFLPLEHKIPIFSPPCNILYIF